MRNISREKVTELLAAEHLIVSSKNMISQHSRRPFGNSQLGIFFGGGTSLINS